MPLLLHEIDSVIESLDAGFDLLHPPHQLSRAWLHSKGKRELQRTAIQKLVDENGIHALQSAKPGQTEAEDYFIAEPVRETCAQLHHIMDFMVTAESYGTIDPVILSKIQLDIYMGDEEEKRLKWQKQKLPKLIARLSFKDANQIAQRYMNYYLRVMRRQAEENVDDFEEIWRSRRKPNLALYQLCTADALDDESMQMNHCIGLGSYDRHLKSGDRYFYSLRSGTRSIVTLEVKDGDIWQIEGKDNDPPAGEWLPHIGEMIVEQGWRPEYNETHKTGLVEDLENRLHPIDRLPKGLQTKHLNLSYLDCEELAIPENASFEGQLNLSGVKSIRSFAKGLVVGGDLILTGCENLEELPSDMTVYGAIRITNCPNLTRLPDRFHACGDLEITGCQNLRKLPRSMKIGGSLRLKRLYSLEEMPESLSVESELTIYGCDRVRSLPTDLKVHKALYLRELKSLESIPNRLNLKQTFSITECPGITELPIDLKAQKEVILWCCPGLRWIPPGLVDSVAYNITIGYCHNLTSLPHRMESKRFFYITNCHSLQRLPDELVVGGNLAIESCPQLQRIPESARANGYINLNHQNGIPSSGIPEWLWVRAFEDPDNTSLPSTVKLELSKHGVMETVPKGMGNFMERFLYEGTGWPERHSGDEYD